MIRINSVTERGNEEIASFVESAMVERGFKVISQQVTHSLENVSKRQFNVIGIMGDPLVDRKIRKGLLLSSHLDTVSPGLLENWTETGGAPFVAEVKDGKIYGLGAADAKLDFLCKLHAAGKFRESKIRIPIYLVGTCGEEMGMFGTKYLIKSMILNPRDVVVGGPTDLQLVCAHKSLAMFRVSINYQQIERDARGFNRRMNLHAFGKAAHSAYPHLGVNAIRLACDFLQKTAESGFDLRFSSFDGGDTVNKVPDKAMMEFYLGSHQFEDFKRFFRQISISGYDKIFRLEVGGVGDAGVRFLPGVVFLCLLEILALFESISRDFEKVRDNTYDPPFSTVNFEMLKQKEGGLACFFDIRILPSLMLDEITRHIQSGIHEIAKAYPNLNISVSKERMIPNFDIGPEHSLVGVCRQAMVESGIQPIISKNSVSTEAALYSSAGYDAVVFGPGKLAGNSHSPNEHNLIDQLEKTTVFYEKLIEKVCL